MAAMGAHATTLPHESTGTRAQPAPATHSSSHRWLPSRTVRRGHAQYKWAKAATNRRLDANRPRYTQLMRCHSLLQQGREFVIDRAAAKVQVPSQAHRPKRSIRQTWTGKWPKRIQAAAAAAVDPEIEPGL